MNRIWDFGAFGKKEALTDDTGNLETYSASDHGYTLTVTLPSSSARYHTQGLRILYLCTLGLFGVGWIIDIIRIIFGTFTDKNGMFLRG